MCIGYIKLNQATRKDHFPLPFNGSNARKVGWTNLLLLSRWIF